MIEKASGEILKGAASKLSPHYYLRGNKESGPERYLIIYKYEYLRLAEGGQCHGDRDQRNQKKRTGISSVQFSGDGCSEWGDGDNGDGGDWSGGGDGGDGGGGGGGGGVGYLSLSCKLYHV